jgi:hypothetical protein
MKAPKSPSRRLLSFLAISCTVCATSIHAGSIGGPPPFTNGSPLTSGVTGTYQASARGKNINGLIRFSYGTNGNPSTTGLNNYVFFVEGTIVSGNVQAAIMNKKLSGVLLQPAVPTVPPTLIDFDSLGGYFNGKFDTMSPFYSFKGKGVLQTYVQTTVAGTIQAVDRKFKLKGMRTSLEP